ncbi:MAG: hypothetical protein IT184_11525 [Acidobacteria bacterium]|nr:hypothetical protein [Acidobacteriota bacterium]
MMNRVAIVLIGLSLAPHLYAQTLPQAEIDKAIALGRAGQVRKAGYLCTAKRTSGLGALGLAGYAVQGAMNAGRASYDILFLGARGRIALAAWDAARSGKPFTATDVDSAWLTPDLSVVVTPRLPDEDSDLAPNLPSDVSKVMFRSIIGKKVLLEQRGEPSLEARQWKNAAGAEVNYSRATVTFDGARAGDLYDDSGINLVVVTADGERQCDAISIRSVRNAARLK